MSIDTGCCGEPFDWKHFSVGRLTQSNLSARSLVVTFFGDIVSVHGGWIWLGSLIEVLASMGISERLVRTSVFRLVKDDWLQVQKRGRRSYYAFTDNAKQVYLQAAKRIYARQKKQSAQHWTLIMPVAIHDDKLQQEFRKQISWMGFNRLTHGVWAHPGLESKQEKASLKATLQAIGVLDQVIIFEQSMLAAQSQSLISETVYQQWGLESLADDWRQFVEAYSPLAERLNVQKIQLTDKGALVIRLLAVHEYRRILLKDYDLPKSMLPDNWSGERATEVLATIYQQLKEPTEKYIVSQLEALDGRPAKADEDFQQRFQS